MATPQEQFTQLIAMMQELTRVMAAQAQLTAAAGTPVGGGQGGGHGGGARPGWRKIAPKSFHRIAKFGKGEEAWKEFHFEFGVILGSESPEMLEVLKVVEQLTDEQDMSKVRAMDEGHADKIDLEKMSKELYEALVCTTDGEAKLMVRNVSSQDGILAWHRLYRHYNRRTLARVLRMHKEAMHPKHVKDFHVLISSIVEWEDRWNRMEKEHTSALPPIWKMAAFIELCPPEVQDLVYQNVDDINEDYEKLKQRVVSWVSNKIANNGPVPMDIGKVGRIEAEDEYEEEDFEVAMIGRGMQCYNCGGWGHASRNCPSERRNKGDYKGDSKGGKDGKGKGIVYGKGGKGKGDGKGKGGGKGYQGACFTCGKVGHKAWECRSGRPIGANAVEEDEYEDDGHVHAGAVEIGTVWNVGAVEVDVNAINKKEVLQITLDSGAGASCWPVELLKEVPMKPRQKGVKFKAANGTELMYHGRKDIKFKPCGGRASCNMEFHVADSTKPLASAMAVVKAGNKVVLDEKGSYILNKHTGERIDLKEVGGTFIFEVEPEVFSRQG
jgi:hypothetical protein